MIKRQIAHSYLEKKADAHNFGRRTTYQEGKVLKFRSINCEFLFTNPKSPLQQLINSLYRSIDPEASLLPSLDSSPTSGPTLLPMEMEVLECSSLDLVLDKKDFLQIGAFSSLNAWAGLTDSHHHNMAIGRDSQGRFIFTSLDWETVFSQVSHPYEYSLFKSLILQDEFLSFSTFHGLSLVKPFVKSPQDIALTLKGHLLMRELLVGNQRELIDTLRQMTEANNLVRRVILRPTREYLKKDISQVYLAEERAQLERGDVPYFFQIGKSKDLFWWKDERTWERVCKPSDLSYSGDYQEPSYPESFRGKMLLSIASSLDYRPGQNYVSSFEDIDVFFKEKTLIVSIDKEIFSGSRLVERE